MDLPARRSAYKEDRKKRAMFLATAAEKQTDAYGCNMEGEDNFSVTTCTACLVASLTTYAPVRQSDDSSSDKIDFALRVRRERIFFGKFYALVRGY